MMRAPTGYGVRAAALATAAAVAVLGAAPAAATDSSTVRVSAPPGVLVSVSAHRWYGEERGVAGTNPKIVEATFSTTEYYDEHRILRGKVWAQAKSTADLNALAVPPPDPFEVTVDVSMTNDEDRAMSGTIVFRTHYIRTASTPSPSNADRRSGEDGGDGG